MDRYTSIDKTGEHRKMKARKRLAAAAVVEHKIADGAVVTAALAVGAIKDLGTFQIIRHSDGRFWIRKNGKVLWFGNRNDTIARAFECFTAADESPILITHPQYVRPLSN